MEGREPPCPPQTWSRKTLCKAEVVGAGCWGCVQRAVKQTVHGWCPTQAEEKAGKTVARPGLDPQPRAGVEAVGAARAEGRPAALFALETPSEKSLSRILSEVQKVRTAPRSLHLRALAARRGPLAVSWQEAGGVARPPRPGTSGWTWPVRSSGAGHALLLTRELRDRHRPRAPLRSEPQGGRRPPPRPWQGTASLVQRFWSSDPQWSAPAAELQWPVPQTQCL